MSNNRIIKRTIAEIKALGWELNERETKYRDGQPCPAGHNAWRYVTNGQCDICNAAYQRERAAKQRRQRDLIHGLLYGKRMTA